MSKRVVWLVYKDGREKPLPRRKRPRLSTHASRLWKRSYRRSRYPTKADMAARQTILVVLAVLLLIFFS